MSNSAVRVGVGTRVVFDGELLEVAELHAGQLGTETVLRSCRGQSGFVRIALHELLMSRRASLVADTHGGGGPDDAGEPADVVLSAISESDRAIIAERAAHVREVLTGYRSGQRSWRRPTNRGRPTTCGSRSPNDIRRKRLSSK